MASASGRHDLQNPANGTALAIGEGIPDTEDDMKTRTRPSSAHLIRFTNNDTMALFDPARFEARQTRALDDVGRNIQERIAARRAEERKAR